MRGVVLIALLSFSLCAEVVVPNGKVLDFEWDGDVKVFHLVAEPIEQELAPGLTMRCWGYNGCTPGPVIEAHEGDRVRIYVTNHLPEYTTVHWHGLILPNGMDGVTGLTQPPIEPGETFVYEFPLVQSGTFMYHPHADEVVQLGMGLVGFFIIHGKDDEPTERDFCIMTQSWMIPQGADAPAPMASEFNYFAFNGKVFPGTEPLVAKIGDRVRMRWGNITMTNHPIHVHGLEFTVTRDGAKRFPKTAQYTAVTVDLPVGDTKDIEFLATNPGDWAVHCHKTHHLMNGMAHGMPNMMHAEVPEAAVAKLRRHIPEFHPMGVKGMGVMFTGRPLSNGPPHFLPYGAPGPFGVIDMGGMFTILKVRQHLETYADPGWYEHPPGTTAHLVNKEEHIETLPSHGHSH